MIIFYLALISLFSILLIKATDIFLVNLKSLSSKSRAGAFAITGLIAALGTSLPEVFVGITSALRGTPNLSLGNIIGANIANLSLVVGGAALLGGAVAVRGDFLKTDVFYAFLAGATPMLLLIDKALSRVDGLILLALYGSYQAIVFRERHRATGVTEEDGFIHRLLRRLNHQTTRRELGWMFLGLALLLFSADILVRVAIQIALILKVPVLLVGLILISIGTCLPELVFETKAAKERQPQMIFGNLLGSIVANATLIIGLVSVISPIRIQAFGEYLLATMAFVIIFAAFYLFIRTKRKLERWEGAFLIGFYLAFALSEFIHP